MSPVYFIFCYVVEYVGDQNKHDSCPYGSHKQMRKNTNDCKENECYKGEVSATSKWVWIAYEFHLVCASWLRAAAR